MTRLAVISDCPPQPVGQASLHKIWYKSPDLLNEALTFFPVASGRQPPNLTMAEKNITMPSQNPFCYRKLAHA